MKRSYWWKAEAYDIALFVYTDPLRNKKARKVKNKNDQTLVALLDAGAVGDQSAILIEFWCKKGRGERVDEGDDTVVNQDSCKICSRDYFEV